MKTLLLAILFCLIAGFAFAQTANPSYYNPTFQQATMVMMGGSDRDLFFDDFFEHEIDGNSESLRKSIVIYDFYFDEEKFVFIRQASLAGFSQAVNMGAMRTFWTLVKERFNSRQLVKPGRMSFTIVFDGSLIFMYDKISGKLAVFDGTQLVTVRQKVTQTALQSQIVYVDLGVLSEQVFVISYISRTEALRFYRLEKRPYTLGLTLVRLPWRLLVKIPWSPIPWHNSTWIPVRSKVIELAFNPYLAQRPLETNNYLDNLLRLHLQDAWRKNTRAGLQELVGVHLLSDVEPKVYLDVQYDSLKGSDLGVQLFYLGRREPEPERFEFFSDEGIQETDPLDYLKPDHEYDIGEEIPGTDFNFSFSHGDVPPRH